MTNGRAASVHARLLARAKARGEDFRLVLSRYAVERFLYRLSISPARDRYWLKGALLFDLWFDYPPPDARRRFSWLRTGGHDWRVCVRSAVSRGRRNGVRPASITVEEIREDAGYGGLRVKLVGLLGKSRCRCNSTSATATR